MIPKQTELLEVEPHLPWGEGENPSERFASFVQAVRNSFLSDSDSVDLELLCDRYLRTIWDLAVSVPLRYFDRHPFDLTESSHFKFFELENKVQLLF